MAQVFLSNVTLGSPSTTASVTTPASGAVLLNNGSTGVIPAWTMDNHAVITAKGKLKVEGSEADIEINGQSMSDWMATVDQRLSILRPDPALLEKYQALQEAYQHYKTLERLVYQKEQK